MNMNTRSAVVSGPKPLVLHHPASPLSVPADTRLSGPAGTASVELFHAHTLEELESAAKAARSMACVAVQIYGSDPDVTSLEPVHAARLVGDFARFLVELRGGGELVCSQGAGLFTFLAPGVNRLQSLRLADKLLWEIRDRLWRVADGYVDLACSVGLAQFDRPERRGNRPAGGRRCRTSRLGRRPVGRSGVSGIDRYGAHPQGMSNERF